MPFIAISVISAGIIGYEILLMRLYSIIQWHHFAFMIISMALLGYGASGTFLSLTRDWLLSRYTLVWQISAALFGLSALFMFAIAQLVPFNPLRIIWEPSQMLYLSQIYLVYLVPFFCGATCIGLAFARFGHRIGEVYCYDLVGAGVGAAGIIGALFVLPAETCLKLVSALGFIAAGIAGLSSGSRYRVLRTAGWLFAGLAFVLLVPPSWTDLRLSEYKPLSTALLVPGTKVVFEQSNPLGLVTVLSSEIVPFRHAPGMSLNNVVEPPEQLGLFVDGDGMTAITKHEGDLEAFAYLDYTTNALPYYLLDRPKVLILGAGSGSDVLLGRYHNSSEINAIEVHPLIADLLRNQYAEFSGHIYAPDQIDLSIADPRAFVAGADSTYDLIQIPSGGSMAGSIAGGLSESYLYTVEAIRDYLTHIRPGGIVALTQPLSLPPRNALKLVNTAIEVMRELGVADPGQRMSLIRSWQTTTLVLKNGNFSEEEIRTLHKFARARSFDLTYYPGMSRDEANRYNLLEEPYLYDGITALLGPERNTFIARYKFDLRFATDNRPYFDDFFKWRTLPEILSLGGQGGASLVELGYLILIASLFQASVLSAILILAPLRFLKRTVAAALRTRTRIAIYFLMLGLAFLFVEIAFIQRLVLFLGHPLYAVALVLAAFLVFSGIGAGLASRYAERVFVGLPAVHIVILGIGVVAVVEILVLPSLLQGLMSLSPAIKVVTALAIMAPLAFLMGMPFPLGLAEVSERFPELVPWAWGINGYASVVSPILATLLAIHLGFTLVVVIAAALYGAAALARKTSFVS